LLINFRADPAVVQALLPTGLSPKLHRGQAIVGICLIRLEGIRPKGCLPLITVSSENAAHRIAVEWTDADGVAKEGVFIPRRDTDSLVNALAGGRLFPGEHNHSRFSVQDDGETISLAMSSSDGDTRVEVKAKAGTSLPESSWFASLEEASAYFESGCIGYSVSCDPARFDGIELKTSRWDVQPLEVTEVYSSFFQNEKRFPAGSVSFDHGLIMREIPHEWHGIPAYVAESTST